MDLVLVRLIFVVVVSITCYFIAPFGLSPVRDAGVGALVGAAIVLFEWKLRAVSLKRLIGAAIGSILGICGAYLFALVIRSSMVEGPTRNFLQILVMLLMAYVGLIVGGIVFEMATGLLSINYFTQINFYSGHFYGAWAFIAGFAIHVCVKSGDMVRALRSRSLSRLGDGA